MKGEKGIFLNRDRYFLYAAVGSAILFLGPAVLNSYWLKICSFLIVNLIIACSWNLLGGYCGYFSFGHGLFFGIGSYTIAIALLRYDVSFYLCIPLGGVIAAVFALAMSPILRLKGFYFTLITLAAVEAAAVIFRKWSFTRGMSSWDVGWSFPRMASDAVLYYLLALTFFLMLVSHIAFLASRRGFSTVAIKEDDLMARGVGVNVTITRVYTFILSAFWVGVAGAIYAPMITYISPQAIFDISWSIKPIIVTIFGGIGTIVGPILGGSILSLIDHLLWERFLEYHNLIYAVLLIGIVMFLPEGLLSYYGRARALFHREEAGQGAKDGYDTAG